MTTRQAHLAEVKVELARRLAAKRRKREDKTLDVCICGYASTERERRETEHNHYGYGACPNCGMI